MDRLSPESQLPLLYEPWFAEEEYRTRLERVQECLVQRNLDGLILFQPESVTWLTGFFTRGYTSFQCVLVPQQGDPITCCRDMEAYYLDHTSVFPERQYWKEDDDPAAVAGSLMKRRFSKASRLGIEMSAWPLSLARYKTISDVLGGIEFLDGTDIVATLRQVKSPAEIRLMRRAAKVAEKGMATASEVTRAGLTERAFAAEVSATLIDSGSDMQGTGVLSSGERALHLHGSYSDKVMLSGETVQFEVLACVRHYHARFMRTIKIDEVSEQEKDLAGRLIKIQDAALAEVGPDISVRVPDQIYRQGVLDAGLSEVYSNKTFYGVGLLLPPSGGETLEVGPQSNWKFKQGMTLHSYVLAQGFGFSETIVVTGQGCERLTMFPRKIIIADGS
jgi:Xaa-Pro dipeptidase